MPYVLLTIAIGSEIIATTLLKYSEGFTKFWPTVASMSVYFICYFTFSKALNGLNLGVAYAIWSGVGLVATAVISAMVFSQKLTTAGVIGIIFIVIGCVILNLYGSAGH